MSHLLFIFLDGVGLGAPDPAANPFLRAEIPTWRGLAGGQWPTSDVPEPQSSRHATVFGADATLGVEGEPQSGTGTTTLLTGTNAAQLLGRHAGPFPPKELHPLLQEENILARAARQGKRAAFANAYPPFYMERLERGKARRTTCTQAALAAGLRLRGIEELERGKALSSWIVNHHWSRLAPRIPAVTAFEAGKNLAMLAVANDVTLFEYFETDHLGHRPDLARATATLDQFDLFLTGITATLDPERDLLVIASDHGNFEAQNHTDHTLNPSLITVWGAGHGEIAGAIRSIADIQPALSSLFF